jgi:hypothetical protein
VSKRSAAQVVCVAFAALASCAWHNDAAARTKTVKRDGRQPPTILCLRPADTRRVREKESDRKILDCLLQTANDANGAQGDQWQSELRRCLSTSGVIRVADCQY